MKGESPPVKGLRSTSSPCSTHAAASSDRYAIVNEADVDAMVKVQAHIKAQPVETNVMALRGVSASR